MFEIVDSWHVLAVADLQTSERYFLDKLGFELCFRVDGWSFIQLGQFRVMLGHCPAEVPARETHNHAYFAYVNCVAIDALYADLQARGAEFRQTLADRPWGSREFSVVTPEGHRIVFGEDIEP